MEDKRVTKYLKSYLTGKKYLENDVDKSFEYFKQCIVILDDIKENNTPLSNDILSIINETETECSKYLSITIEKTLDKPLVLYKYEQHNELFKMIEESNYDKIEGYTYGDINFNVYNNIGLSPLHYAISFGDTKFIKLALKLGANIDITNKYGHTLLEFACLEKDPNIIEFLLNYGADMKKHLLFREDNNYFNGGNEIDICILEKIILSIDDNNKYNYLDFVYNYINDDTNINLGIVNNDTNAKLEEKINIKILNCLINKFDEDKRNTYIDILNEELKYNLVFKLGCPITKLEIILYNLVPFISDIYNNNLGLSWLISLEVKFILLNILKNKKKINIIELKKELSDLLYNKYIKDNIIKKGLLQTIVLQWFNKIKV